MDHGNTGGGNNVQTKADILLLKSELSYLQTENRKRGATEKCSITWWKLGSLFCLSVFSVPTTLGWRTHRHGNHYVGQFATEYFRNLLRIY